MARDPDYGATHCAAEDQMYAADNRKWELPTSVYSSTEIGDHHLLQTTSPVLLAVSYYSSELSRMHSDSVSSACSYACADPAHGYGRARARGHALLNRTHDGLHMPCLVSADLLSRVDGRRCRCRYHCRRSSSRRIRIRNCSRLRGVICGICSILWGFIYLSVWFLLWHLPFFPFDFCGGGGKGACFSSREENHSGHDPSVPYHESNIYLSSSSSPFLHYQRHLRSIGCAAWKPSLLSLS